MKVQTSTGAGVVLVLSALAGACGSAPPPTARLASSEGAVRAAQELDANAIPDAQLHLKLARDQLDDAKRLMANGDNERAEFVLLRAESDADVAIALAKESRIRKQANDALEQVQKARTSVVTEPSPTPAPMTPPAPTPTGTIPDATIPPSVGR